MKNKVITSILLLTLIPTIIYASTSEAKIDDLTKEQKKLQKQIKSTSQQITDLQIELDSLSMTIDANNNQISTLETKSLEKKKDIENQTDNIAETLQLMQRLTNNNSMVQYLADDNEQNFILRYRNVKLLTEGISSDIKQFVDDLSEINNNLNSIKSYNEQNTENMAQIDELIAKQENLSDEIQQQVNSIDIDINSLQKQINIDEAQKLEQELQEKASIKAEEEINTANEEAANQSSDPIQPEVTEPEVPEVTEPEMPEVTEPEVPEVTEPEVPEVVDPDTSYPADGNVSSYKKQIISAAGISSSDYNYVDYIITKESGWNYLISNPYSGAYGLCQALPGSKMASAGSDWATNPETQMKWCNSYAVSRYGSWSGAYAFWLENNWW